MPSAGGSLPAKPHWTRRGWTPRERLYAGLLVSSYVFGAVMLATDAVPGFVYLTAFHLCLSATLLLAAHRPWVDARPTVWLVTCGLLGWGAEYVGVHGGWLFGEYAYGDVLGPKWRAIPLVLAVNWILVVYAVCATVAARVPHWPTIAKVAAAAALMVALDILIEPVAIGLDFWTWRAGTPPLQNYIGWLAVSLAQAALFFALLPFSENRLASLVLLLQVGFFATLYFAL